MPVRVRTVFCAVALALGVLGRAEVAIGGHAPANVTPFSVGVPGPALPGHWLPFRLGFWKAATTYELVEHQGATVLRGLARRSASGLAHRLDVNPEALRRISWRWMIVRPVLGADNRRAEAEDAPARLVLEFDRIERPRRLDSAGLDFARLLTTPYDGEHALLMYVWSVAEPVGTVIPSPRSAHVKMIVAASGAGAVGRWEALSRDYNKDFHAAFGNAPPQLTGIAVMSDADNTGEVGEALYGDILIGR